MSDPSNGAARAVALNNAASGALIALIHDRLPVADKSTATWADAGSAARVRDLLLEIVGFLGDAETTALALRIVEEGPT
jgi:hypothetical protein